MAMDTELQGLPGNESIALNILEVTLSAAGDTILIEI